MMAGVVVYEGRNIRRFAELIINEPGIQQLWSDALSGPLGKALLKFFTVIRRRISLVVTPDFVDLWGAPELRLPRVEAILGPTLFQITNILEDRQAVYFRTRAILFPENIVRLSAFTDDRGLDGGFPRHKLIRIVIAKVLIAAAAANVLPRAIFDIRFALRKLGGEREILKIHDEVAKRDVVARAFARSQDRHPHTHW